MICAIFVSLKGCHRSGQTVTSGVHPVSGSIPQFVRLGAVTAKRPITLGQANFPARASVLSTIPREKRHGAAE
jgi:hypothetical protein